MKMYLRKGPLFAKELNKLPCTGSTAVQSKPSSVKAVRKQDITFSFKLVINII